MPDVSDEDARLLEALAPFKAAAAKAGYAAGVEQGILTAYTTLIHWAVRGENREIDDTERKRRLDNLNEGLAYLEREHPIIRKTYPEKQ